MRRQMVTTMYNNMYNMSSRLKIFLIFMLILIHVKRIEDENGLNKNEYIIISWISTKV